MFTLRIPALALVFGLTLSACGGDDATPVEVVPVVPEATPAPAPTVAAEVPPYDGPAADVAITPVGETMAYAETEFTVHPGQTVKLTFTNTATSEAMHHNVVVLTQGATANDVGQAAMTAADSDYIPASFADQIIAHTSMSAPGETVTVEFTAPAVGDYTYICTFPGHYMMMKGTMRVVA